jgi:hypothetical protein
MRYKGEVLDGLKTEAIGKKFDIDEIIKTLDGASQEMIKFHTDSNPDSKPNQKAIKVAIASLKKIKNF